MTHALFTQLTPPTLKRALLAMCISVLAAASAPAQTSGWRDESGKPVAETESMKAKDGFGGSLLATTDADWREKWNTPPDTKPTFTPAGTVPYGKRVFILIFFVSPKTDDRGTAHVRCDLRVVAPTGKVSIDQKDANCYEGPLLGGPYSLRLSDRVIGFSGDPGDPPGVWSAEVVVRDDVRKVEIPLRTTFTLR